MILPGEGIYKTRLMRPCVNNIAEGTVEYIQNTHVIIKIKRVDGIESVEVPGVIHREDAMYGIKDSEKLNELFSPGDTIIGRILSLGETGPVVISTADPSHGVVRAVDYTTGETIRIAQNKLIHKGKELKRKIAIL